MVGHHPDAVPTGSQQSSDAFCNLGKKQVDMLGKLPAACMPLAVDAAQFAPRVALASAVFGTVQHFPIVVVQQMLQVVTTLQGLTGGSDTWLEVITVIGTADLGSHWRNSRLAS